MIRVALVACCLWLTAAVPADRLAILSAPGIAPNGHATILVHVARHADNERLVVALLDGAFVNRRSDQPLARVQRTTFEYRWWNLPDCACTLVVVLYDRRAEVARAVRPLIVR